MSNFLFYPSKINVLSLQTALNFLNNFFPFWIKSLSDWWFLLRKREIFENKKKYECKTCSEFFNLIIWFDYVRVGCSMQRIIWKSVSILKMHDGHKSDTSQTLTSSFWMRAIFPFIFHCIPTNWNTFHGVKFTLTICYDILGKLKTFSSLSLAIVKLNKIKFNGKQDDTKKIYKKHIRSSNCSTHTHARTHQFMWTQDGVYTVYSWLLGHLTSREFFS